MSEYIIGLWYDKDYVHYTPVWNTSGRFTYRYNDWTKYTSLSECKKDVKRALEVAKHEAKYAYDYSVSIYKSTGVVNKNGVQYKLEEVLYERR